MTGSADGARGETPPGAAAAATGTAAASTRGTPSTSAPEPLGPVGIATRIAGIVAFVVVPLVGILAFGWDWREIVLLYWLENIGLGLANVVRILRAGATGAGIGSRIATSLFFCVHYGIFTVVHGVFVVAIISGALAFGSSSFAADASVDPTAGPWGQPESSTVDWVSALLIAAVGGVIHLLVAIVGPRPTEAPAAVMGSAYPRIVVLHVAILGGSFLIAFLGLPAAAAIVLIAIHGVIDARSLRAAIRGEAPKPVFTPGKRTRTLTF